MRVPVVPRRHIGEDAFRYHREFGDGLDGKYALVAQIVEPCTSVLEVGCSTGYFGRELVHRGHRVVGVEIDESAARKAREHGLEVICASIETAINSMAMEQFDAILLMDVLEHLSEPGEILAKLAPLLAAKGQIVITVPNVAYWRVRADLLRGRWEYRESGIMDRTHLRFYTISGWRNVVEGAGLRVSRFGVAEAMIPLEGRLEKLGVSSRIIRGIKNMLVSVFPALFCTVAFVQAEIGAGAVDEEVIGYLVR